MASCRTVHSQPLKSEPSLCMLKNQAQLVPEKRQTAHRLRGDFSEGSKTPTALAVFC